MKKSLLSFFFIAFTLVSQAQIVNENNSIVWYPHSYDPRISFTIYSKGLMAGVSESVELIIQSHTSDKIAVKVSYSLTDMCGTTKEYTKSEILENKAFSKSSGAFFSGIDFETNCKEVRNFMDNIKSKISSVYVTIVSVENLTEKAVAEEKLKKEKEKQVEEQQAEEKLKKEKEKQAEEQQAEEKLKKEKEKQQVEKEKEELEEKKGRKKEQAKVTPQKTHEEITNDAKREIDASDWIRKGDIAAATDPTYAIQCYQMGYGLTGNFAHMKIISTKIDNLKAKVALNEVGKLVNDGLEKLGEGVDQLSSDMDAVGVPKSMGAGFCYDGFLPSFKGFGTNKIIRPMSASVVYGTYRVFAVEAGLTYLQSPVYKFGLEENNTYTGKDIEGSYTAVGPEISAGFAYPHKYFDLYAMYGFYFPFVLTGTPHTEGYTYKDFKDNFGVAAVISKIKFGIHIKIPKAAIGIGVHYIINGVNREKLLTGGYRNVTDKSSNHEYGLGSGGASIVDKSKYNILGVSLYLLSSRSRQK